VTQYGFGNSNLTIAVYTSTKVQLGEKIADARTILWVIIPVELLAAKSSTVCSLRIDSCIVTLILSCTPRGWSNHSHVVFQHSNYNSTVWWFMLHPPHLLLEVYIGLSWE